MTKTIFRNLMLAAGLVSMVALSSCEEDGETPVPTINLSDNNVDSASVGDSVTIGATVSSSEDLETITIRLKNNDLDVKDEGFTGDTNDEYSFTYGVDSADAGSELTFTIIAENSEGGEASQDYVLNVGEMTEEPQGSLTEYSGELLAAPIADQASESFYAMSSGEEMTVSQANSNKAEVDFGYRYDGSNGGAILLSPEHFADFFTDTGDGAEANDRQTEFKSTSGVDFATATYADVTAAFENGTATNNSAIGIDNNSALVGLAEGEVYAVKSADDMYAIIEITSITEGTGVDGEIEFDIKVQTIE